MNLKSVLNDERGFVHKRLFGAAKGFLGGGPLGAVSGFFGGGGNGFAQRQAAATAAALARQQAQQITRPPPVTPIRVGVGIVPNLCESFPFLPGCDDAVPGGPPLEGGDDCRPPNFMVGEICVAPGTPAGPPGQAVMGQFGAALEPTFFTINQRQCLPGMILGKDKLCYNKGSISNKERLWPKGTAPLLTGGEMSAIRKAASAAKKFQRTGQRFKALGFIKTPTARRAPKRITAGTVKVLESGPGSVQL